VSKIDGKRAQNRGRKKGTPNKLKTQTLRENLTVQVQAAVETSGQTYAQGQADNATKQSARNVF
jgi:hypothetical protein